jgi:hypothetical protein
MRVAFVFKEFVRESSPVRVRGQSWHVWEAYGWGSTGTGTGLPP